MEWMRCLIEKRTAAQVFSWGSGDLITPGDDAGDFFSRKDVGVQQILRRWNLVLSRTMITDYLELLPNVFGGFVGSILASTYRYIQWNQCGILFWHTVWVQCKDFSQVLLIEKSVSMHHYIRVEISELPRKIKELYPKALGHMYTV